MSEAAAPPKPRFSTAILHIRDFRLMLCIRMLSLMALNAQDVITQWQLYSMTHDVFLLGLLGLVEAVPALIASFFAGHVVDTGRPHRIYAMSVCALACNLVALTVIAGGIIPVSDNVVLPVLFFGIFISGLARGFIAPSSYSLMPQIVGRPNISAASAWGSTGMQLGLVTGPAVAGLVYGYFGTKAAWMIAAVMMLGALFAVLQISVNIRGYRSNATREPTLKSIRAGMHFVWSRPALLSIMALDMFAVLFGGAVAMLPAYADQILHTGPGGLGWLRSAPALGAICSAIFFATHPMQRVKGRTMFYVVSGFALCIIVFGLSTSFALSMIALAASGAFDSISVIIRTTLVQLLTTDEMRGRVSSLNSMFIISSNEIGAFESGTAAKLLGLVPSVVFGGVMSLFVVAVIGIACPQLRKLEVESEST